MNVRRIVLVLLMLQVPSALAERISLWMAPMIMASRPHETKEGWCTTVGGLLDVYPDIDLIRDGDISRGHWEKQYVESNEVETIDLTYRIDAMVDEENALRVDFSVRQNYGPKRTFHILSITTDPGEREIFEHDRDVIGPLDLVPCRDRFGFQGGISRHRPSPRVAKKRVRRWVHRVDDFKAPSFWEE